MSALKASLSRETYDLIASSADFFESVISLNRRFELGLQLSSEESHTETRKLQNGDLAVTYVYTLDDNYRSEDGRLYLKDTFVFDSKGEKFKKFDRNFEFNGRGSQAGKWQDLLEKYRKAPSPADPLVQKFARTIASTYSRPLYSNPEFWRILKSSEGVQAFFGAAGRTLQKVKPGYSIKSLDPQSAYVLVPKGDRLELVLNWVLDNDAEPHNERLFLQDRFEIDPKTGTVKNYSRNWLPPRKAVADRKLPKVSEESKRTLERLQRLPSPSLEEAQKLIQEMWPAFRSNRLRFSDWDLEQDLKGNHEFFRAFRKLDSHTQGFLVQTGRVAQTLRSDWVLRGSDKESRIRLHSIGNRIEIYMTTVLAKYHETDKNRVYCHDRFVLSKKDFSLKDYSRHFEALDYTFNDGEFSNQVALLNQTAIPSREGARKFISAIAPALIPVTVDRMEHQLDDSPQKGPVKIPENYIPLALREQEPEISSAQSQETLALLKRVALERTQRAVGASKGWLHFGGKKDLRTEVTVVESLFKKLENGLKEKTGTDFLTLLESLELNPKESALRARLLQDPLILEINHIGQESDPQIRDRDLMVLAREKLFKKYQLYGSAYTTAEILNTRSFEKNGAGELLAFLQGKGSLGTKFELMGSTFLDHVMDRNMVLAMLGGGIVGAKLELAGLNRLGQWGRFGRVTSKVLGLSGEAAAFTTIHKAGQSLDQDPGQAWKHWGSETVSAALLFGGMRLGHWGTANLSEYLGLGGVGWRAGWAGQTLRKSLEVGAGVESMYLAGVLGRYLGLQQPNPQSLGHHQFDALVMYAQAMVGFGIADRISGHGLRKKLAELKFETKIKEEELKRKPEPLPETPAWLSKPSDPTPLPPAVPYEVAEPTPIEIPTPSDPPQRLPIGTPWPRAETEGRLPLPPDPEPEPEPEGSGEVILLDHTARKSPPPLPPPTPPAKEKPQGEGAPKKDLSDGVPVDPWADEPTAPHGRVLVSEIVAKETIPRVLTEIIRKGILEFLQNNPGNGKEMALRFKLRIRDIIRKAEIFPENEIPPDYKDEVIQVGLRIDPQSRILTLSPRARNALKVQIGNELDPILKSVYQALIGIDGIALKARGKRAARESARHRAPTARPWPGHPAMPEVLDFNEQALQQRQIEMSPTRFDWVKEIAVHRSRYLEGILTMDPDGRIETSQLYSANFDSPERIWEQLLGSEEKISVPVIISRKAILWHGPLPEKMNAIQRAAFHYLKDEAEEVLAEDPYGVDALLNQRMGPLALDFGELLTEQFHREGEGSHSFEILLYNDKDHRALRAYEKESIKPVPNSQPVGKIDWTLNVKSDGALHLESLEYSIEPTTPHSNDIVELLDFLEKRFQNRGIPGGKSRPSPVQVRTTEEKSDEAQEWAEEWEDPETDFSDSITTGEYQFRIRSWDSVPDNQEILSGERVGQEPPRFQNHYEGIGDFAGISDQGVGYKNSNEDVLTQLIRPKDIYINVFDGAGGHAGGKEASNLAALTINASLKEGNPLSEAAQIANDILLRDFPEAKTTLTSARIIPSPSPDQPSRLQFLWAGDSKGLLLRRDSEGKWQWVYRTQEESYSRNLVDADIEAEGKTLAEGGVASRRTQEIVIHPHSNVVYNILGVPEPKINTTEGGELYDPQMGVRSAEDVFSLNLKKGDLVLLGSDGLFDNFIRTRSLLDLIEGLETPQEMADLLHWEASYRMQVLSWAAEAYTNGSLPRESRFVFEYQGLAPHLQGKTLYLEYSSNGTGRIFDAPQGGNLVGHYKRDNISVAAYLHQGESGPEGPPELPPPPTNLIPSSREAQKTPIDRPKKKTMKK